MATVTLYTFEDRDGDEGSTFSTFSATEAKDHGERYALRVIANEYEYSDREVAWDFTGLDEEEGANDEG